MKEHQKMRLIFPGLGFITTIRYLISKMWKLGPKLTLSIIVLDTLSVLSRIAAVLSLSFMAAAMRNDGQISLASYKISITQNTLHLGLIGAGAISSLLALSALFSFLSILLARRMARRLNDYAINETIQMLEKPPASTINASTFNPSIYNRLLTQNAIHLGMMGETLLKMVNPILMFIFAWALVAAHFPILGISIVLFSILFLPIIIKMFLKTKSVAKDFYAKSANIMGKQVSNYVLNLNPQYGVFSDEPPLKPLAQHPDMSKFLDNLDKNILANERIGLLVGLAGAFLIAIVISINSYLLNYNLVDIPAMISLTGGLLFLLASARTVMSMLTNLVRFFPQVKIVRDFIDQKVYANSNVVYRNIPNQISIIPTQVETSELNKVILKIGEQRTGLIVPSEMSRYNIKHLIQPLASKELPIEVIANNMVFVSSKYRFRPNVTINQILCAGQDSLSQKAHEIANNLDVLSEYSSFANGLDSIMDDNLWDMLSGPARTFLRLIPIFAQECPRFVFIDVGVVKNLNPKTFDNVFSNLKDCYVFIVMNNGFCPDNLVDMFLFSDGVTIKGAGSKDWVDQQDLSNVDNTNMSASEVFL